MLTQNKMRTMYAELYDQNLNNVDVGFVRPIARMLRGVYSCIENAVNRTTVLTANRVSHNGEDVLEYVHYLENHPWGCSGEARLRIYASGKIEYIVDVLPGHRRLLRGLTTDVFENYFKRAVGALIGSIENLTAVDYLIDEEVIVYTLFDGKEQ